MRGSKAAMESLFIKRQQVGCNERSELQR